MNKSVSSAVSSVAGAQPDYIAIAMVVILALIVIALVIRKHMQLKTAALKASTKVDAAVQEPKNTAAAAPGSAGDIKLYDVEPRTAAMLMAIVADSTGIPLNELRFISVREIK
ncbi:MAG: hypothetical protein IJB09_06175 [Oscillospiraceae bacterium]|nr:hypothetical protein [Oscillospiraceae bacterium]